MNGNAPVAAALEAAIRGRLAEAASGWSIRVADRLPSTSDALKDLAAAGAPEGTVIVAREQTRGRGRRDHTWFSPPDKGLYLSVLLRPPWAAAEGGWLTVAGTLAVVRTLALHGIAEAEVKPPNDVLCGGLKISGVLVEPRIARGRIEFAVVGLGVNLAHAPADFAGTDLATVATSCAMLGHPVAPGAFAGDLLTSLAGLYAESRQGNRDAVLEEWLLAGGSADLPGLIA